MLLQAIIERELRVQSRSRGTTWLRVLTGGAAAGVLAAFLLLGQDTALFGRKNVGPWLFAALHTTISVLLALTIPAMSADTLARERREGTLGILLLTPLRPWTIVAGKMAAHLFRAMTLWLATVPVLMAPLLLGGIGWTDVTFGLVIELGVVLGSLSAGLVASSLSESSGRAVALAAALTLVIGELLALISFLGLWPYLLVHSGSVYARHMLLTGLFGPWFVGTGLIENGFSGILGSSPVWLRSALWTALAAVLAGSIMIILFAFWFAGRGVRRVGKEQQRTAKQEARRRFWFQPLLVERSRRRLQGLLTRNPMLWLYTFRPSSRLNRWGWCGVVLLVWVGVYLVGFEDNDTGPWVTAVLIALVVSAAYAAAESFRRELEQGSLELLLVTPLRPAAILWARVLAIWMDFLPALLGATALLVVWTTVHSFSRTQAAILLGAWSSVAIVPLVGSRLGVRRISTLFGWAWTLLLGVGLPSVFAALAAITTQPVEDNPAGFTFRFMVVFLLFQAAEGVFCARLTITDLATRRYQLRPLRRRPA